MEYDRVQRYATAYQLQDEYERLQTQTMDDFLQLDSYILIDFDPEKVTREEAMMTAKEVRGALAHLMATEQMGEALGKTYEKALVP